MIINFKDFSEKTSVAEVGGKAYNLMKMMNYGINVPEGFTLSVDFFDPWFEDLKDSQQWKDFYNAAKNGKVTKKQCDDLKDAAENFTLTVEQKNELNRALESLPSKQSTSSKIILTRRRYLVFKFRRYLRDLSWYKQRGFREFH